ncbi:MAG: amidase [Spirochaetales bacterium]
MRHAPQGYRSFAARSLSQARARLVAVLDRIEQVEPEIEALLPEPDRRGRVLAEFEKLAVSHPDPADWPDLFAVPVAVKDLFGVTGFPTLAGSRLPPDVLPSDEAEVVRRLRAAGAIVVGKSVTTEFAYFQPGPTRNPWNTDHTPGGSSSGSAAAVSAGYAPLALGTQTIGSINRPASYCGVVGFKPSHGRVPTAGVFPFSPWADHVGLLAADVASANVGASVLWDDWRSTIHMRPGKTLLIVDDAYTSQADLVMRAAITRAAERLTAAGYNVHPIELFPDIGNINNTHNTIIAHEFAHVHEAYGQYHGRYSERSLELMTRGSRISAASVSEAKSGRAGIQKRIRDLLAQYDASALLSPSAQGAAPFGIDATGSPVMNLPWTYAGVPTVTVQCGFDGGLPLGLQIAGAYGEDEELLTLASFIEPIVSPD